MGVLKMKLRRTWPAIGIWAVFLIFDIVMVTSLGFFLGLFPSDKALIYSGVLTALGVLAMSVTTILLGKLSERLNIVGLKENIVCRIVYSCLSVLIIAGGVFYRVEILSNSSGDVSGKYSLYENAIVGNTAVTPEYDLLSIAYSAILKGILFFTGNIISVPFLFQIACFAIFMICGFFTVKKLLGVAASLVFSAYVAFMPVFTYRFTGLELSTDSLFMAMFGIELLVMALFLQGAYRKVYGHPAFVIWYLFVGVVVGFMAYVDAGTIIMILPFIIAVLFLKGTIFRQEIVRLLFVILGAVVAFAGMIAQEQGFMMAYSTLAKWSGFYFHNLNTFSMFWIYTDHKVIYLVTAIVMSGVMVGFWRNRDFENISPWLVSMLLIFATVPFMGATRMNTQVFVSVYYAFILACVADLITTPSDETVDDTADNKDKKKKDTAEDDTAPELKDGYILDPALARVEVIKPQYSEHELEPWQKIAKPQEEWDTDKEEPESFDNSEPRLEGSKSLNDSAPAWNEKETFDSSQSRPEEELSSDDFDPVRTDTEPAHEAAYDTDQELDAFFDNFDPARGDAEPVSATEQEPVDSMPADDFVSSETASPLFGGSEHEKESSTDGEEQSTDIEPQSTDSEPQSTDSESHKQRFVPEGMVLPEDDDDVDLTPRMKMPQLSAPVGPDGKAVKLKVGGNSQLSGPLETKDDKLRDDFDIAFTPGDDFDI
jgi:hypothetical protein